jgi:DNA polymerase-1
MREAVRAFGLEPIEKAGFEADDLIATYAREAEAAGADVLIISSDKDLMQLVDDRVRFYDFESGVKGRRATAPSGASTARRDRLFRRPARAGARRAGPDRRHLRQRPGVPGIGMKTASALIGEYGDLETLLARAEEIKQPKRRELLTGFAEQARMSKRLVTLDTRVEIDTPLAATRVANSTRGS